MHPSDFDIRNRLLIARLPAMPQILIKLIGHLQADDLGMKELAALIANDAGMTARLLSVANSSAYHRGARSAGVEQALTTLGTDMIKLLVIGESVVQTFNSFPHSGSIDLRRFWKHSLLAAVIARELATRMGYAHAEEAYLGGLLHNVGRLALLATAPQEYGFNFTARDDEDLCAVEQRTLQITHAEAGAWLVERWNLDSFLADAVLYHHEPNPRLQTSHPLIRIVRLAHLVASHDAADSALDGAMALCGIDAPALEQVREAAGRQVLKVAAQLGIDLDGADEIAAPPAWAARAPDPVQQRLADEVRSLVLVSEAGQALARQDSEGGLLEAMTRSARILFDFDTTVLLLEKPASGELVGVPTPQHQRVADFAVPLGRGGALAQVALDQRMACFDRAAPELGLAEQQLLRILGSESMVCVPLVNGSRCLGLLVGGVAAWQVSGCRQRERFLQAFGGQAAQALQTALSERGQARRQLASATEEFREASRRVVHEVNNPLAIIKNYLSVLDNKLAKREPVVGEMSILNEEIDRVGQLISGLAELPTDVRGGTVDCARVADEVLRLFRATEYVPANVQLVAAGGQQAALAEGDAAVLKQILVNLVKNAIEALGEGGRIEIACRGHVSRERRVYVELVVSDNGPGMTPDVMANLFSPVRSSKPGDNHGLGLSIVHALVRKMDGMISCRSGRAGTAFEILLPACGGASNLAGAPARLMDSV